MSSIEMYMAGAIPMVCGALALIIPLFLLVSWWAKDDSDSSK